MRVFKVLDDKSIIKADSRLFWTLFLVQFPHRNRGENSLFSYFPEQKYRKLVKTIFANFDPLFLVQFPYRNRGENRCFLTFPKQKYRKC